MVAIPTVVDQILRVTLDLLFKVGVIPTMVVFAYIYSLQVKTR